jgi:hypothetical protein
VGFGEGIRQRKQAWCEIRNGVQVFFDPFVRIEDASVDDELRDAAIGLTENWNLLFVVHISREDDKIRIISARPATAQERRSYEDND